MPVPGIPPDTMRRISLAESFCACGLVTMFGARSLPRPSSPWQAEQLDVKICCPFGRSIGCLAFTAPGPVSCEYPGAAVAVTAKSKAGNHKACLPARRPLARLAQQKHLSVLMQRSAQNENLAPNCKMRGSRAAVTMPKELELIPPFGLKN